MTNIQTILEVNSLTKEYGEKTAVKNFSLTIKEGEFWGLLGPNGAGKTTTIKLLTGLTKPNEGKILYFGNSFFSHPKQAKKLIGVVPQHSNLDRDLTAFENLNLHAILHAIPKKLRKEKIDQALEFAGLQDYKSKQVKTFSGGMKRRLVIVRSLLHDPKILFLDEPTVGLDPQIRRSLWDLVVKVNQVKKTAILLTTHYIEEADKLCQQIKIINSGTVIADDTPEKLKKKVGNFILETYNGERHVGRFFLTKDEATAHMKKTDQEAKVREVTLEDVFIKLTGRRINV
ncbi:MAG: ABC transporter ATP-binding protein [Proteobacteria bacterium]|nr:ABC transporter ATP-binding protein [Pseudomonadota bacterium]